MKIINILTFLVFILGSTQAFAVLERERKLINLVKIEIGSIQKLKKRNSQLNYRLFELYSERLRLKRKVETHYLIKNKLTKKKAFAGSNKMYENAQKFGHLYLKKYKNSRYVPDVYLKLAANVIEIKNDLKKYEKKISYYLDRALEKGKSPEIVYRAKVVMAELYYNLKKFKKAETYYKDVVLNRKDLAYTKNMLNYSWSLFQNRKYTQAIKEIKFAHKAWLNNKKYYDVNDRIATAINYFNVYNKTPENAVDFHARYNKDNLIDLYYKLLTLSQKIISAKKSLIVEGRARNYCSKLKNISCLFRLSEFKLQLYREGRDYVRHMKTVASITSEFKKLNKEQRIELKDSIDESINNIGEVSSFIQKFVYKEHYLLNDNRELTYSGLISNYKNLKVLNKKMMHEYDYLAGELSYKEIKLQPASQFYLSSFKTIPVKSKPKFLPKLLKSMLSLANEKQFQNDKFYEFTSTEYISFYPKQKKSEPVYKNLFNFYISKKELVKPEGLIKLFNKNRVDLIKTQRDMYTVLITEHIKLKNIEKITHVIIELKKGYLAFSPIFIDKNVKILGDLVFEKTGLLEKQGKIAEVTKEYEAIYNNTLFPKEIRLNGAFNLAIKKVQSTEVDEAYQWVQLVLKEDAPEDLKLKLNPMLGIAEQMIVNQRLEKSKTIYNQIASKYCLSASEYPNHYLKSQEVNLAFDDLKTYQTNLNRAHTCKVDLRNIGLSRKSLVNYYLARNDKKSLMTYIKAKPSFRESQSDVYNHFYSSFWFHYKPEQLNIESRELNDLRNFVTGNSILDRSSVDSWNELQSFLSLARRVMTVDLSITALDTFDLKKFESSFGRAIGALNELKQKALKILDKTKDSQIYTATLALNYHYFEKFRDVIKDYEVNSENKDILVQVKQNLKQIESGLNDQLNEFKLSYSNAIKEKSSLNHFLKFFDKPEDVSFSITSQELSRFLASSKEDK